MKNFKNKVVAITGAGSGMGRAYAMAFAQLGAKLALNDYNETTLAETKETIEKKGVKDVYTQVFNVSNKEAMYDFASQTKKHFGNAHIIINNAGIGGAFKPGYLITEEEIERVMAVNFYGVVYGCKAFLPQIVANNEGAIVNVSSISGLVGQLNQADYTASKFAVRGYTEVLMSEFYKSPISVHCVHPGGINTNIGADQKDASKYTKKYLTTPPEKIVQYVIKSIQKKRSKIVYGNQSQRVWLGANIMPQNIMNGLLWNELKKLVDLNEYKTFIKNLKW